MKTSTETQFDTLEHHQLTANPSLCKKVFGGKIVYKGAEVEALSERIGLEEYGMVLDYRRKGKTSELLIEFCGDSAVWPEWVAVEDCKMFDIRSHL